MQDVSDRFLSALTRSHKIVAGASLMVNGRAADTLPITGGGAVDVESAADVRRRCSFTVPDELRRWVPKGRSTDPLNPYGTVVTVWRGIQYPDVEDPEIVGLGTFAITSIGEAEDRGSLSVSGRDFSHLVNRTLRRPVPIGGTTRRDVAAAKVLTSTWPAASYRFAESMEGTRPMLIRTGDNGLTEARKIVRSGGYNLYPDIDGTFIMPPLPGSLGGTVPVATIRDGVGGTLVGSERSWSSEDNPFNGVIVEGAAIRGRPVRYEIWDERIDSLTWRGGAYGENPDVIVDDQITDVGQAIRLARARLQRHLGKGVEAPGTMLVNPALDVDDLVTLRRYDDLPEAYFVHSLSIPLGAADMMSFTLRRGIFGDEEVSQEVDERVVQRQQETQEIDPT